MREHGFVDSRLFDHGALGRQIPEEDGEASGRMVGLVDGTNDFWVTDLLVP